MKRIVGVLLCLAACKGEVKPDAKAPDLENQELTVVSQSLTEFEVKLTGKLKCYDACSATKAKWELVVDSKVVKSGEQPLSLSLAAGAAGDVTMQQGGQYVANAEELQAMDARGGSLLMALRGTLYVSYGDHTHEVAFARSHEVRTPRLPHPKFQELEAGRFSEDEAGITFHVGVFNPNPFQLKLNSLKYKVQIAGKLVAEGEVGKGERVDPASTGVFDIETHVDASTHGDAEIKKLIKSKTLPYVLSGEMSAEMHTEPFEYTGDIKLNVSK